MIDMDVEKSLEALRDRMYVNDDLKHKLRGNFIRKKRLNIARVAKPVIAAVICLIIAGYAFLNSLGTGKVSAASLKVENYKSLMSIGDGRNTGVSEHNGTIYVTAFESGILSYSDKGIEGIYSGNSDYVSISGNGKMAAVADKGSIKIFHMDSGRTEEILKGDGENEFYEQPSWLPEDRGILYTKRMGAKNTEGEIKFGNPEIYSYGFDTSKSTIITRGLYPSFIKGQDAIVFEREGNIMYKSLKDGSEKAIDEGCQPYASPDGRYVAYVRSDINTREIEKNVYVEQGLQDIYIADTDNFSIRKKITSNIPLINIDENEWLMNLEKSDEPQTLSYSGKYCYLYPVWSSDSRSIIAMRKEYPLDPRVRIKSDMVRIDLGDEKLSPEETVKRYLHAVASGDEDYANTITEGKGFQEGVKGLNITGFSVLDPEEKKGYIDAEILYGRDDKLYAKWENNRYFTAEKEGKATISEVKTMETVEVMEEGGIIYMKKNAGERTRMFGMEDIPQNYKAGSGSRINSLAYSPTVSSLYFTVENPSVNNGDNIIAAVYNLDNKQFTIIDDLKGDGLKVNRLAGDVKGDYVVLDYSATEKGELRSQTKVYGIKDKNVMGMKDFLKDEDVVSVGVDFWEGSELVLRVSATGQLMRIIFSPMKNQIKIL